MFLDFSPRSFATLNARVRDHEAVGACRAPDGVENVARGGGNHNAARWAKKEASLRDRFPGSHGLRMLGNAVALIRLSWRLLSFSLLAPNRPCGNVARTPRDALANIQVLYEERSATGYLHFVLGLLVNESHVSLPSTECTAQHASKSRSLGYARSNL